MSQFEVVKCEQGIGSVGGGSITGSGSGSGSDSESNFEIEDRFDQDGQTTINRGRWTKRERQVFEEGFRKYGKEWKLIARLIGTRTVIQIRTHAQKYFQKLAKETGGPVLSTSKKEGLPRGWSPKKVPLIESGNGDGSVEDGSSPSDILGSDDNEDVNISTPSRNTRKRKRSEDEAFISSAKPDATAVRGRGRGYKLRGTRSRKIRAASGYSIDTLMGSSSEQEQEQDFDCVEDEISKELAFYNDDCNENNSDVNVNVDFVVMQRNSRVESGRVTPSMLAAATILLAPRLNERISTQRLAWAQNFLAQY